MTIHQITFLYQDCEIAYSESEDVVDAFNDANEQFEYGPYDWAQDEITVRWVEYTGEGDYHGCRVWERDYHEALTVLC